MRLVDLCNGCLEIPARQRNLEVQGIASDSRRVEPGDLFVALSGPSADGHVFARAAARAGAVAVLGERTVRHSSSKDLGVPYLRTTDTRRALGHLCDVFYGRPSRELDVVGVTGTKGKTTTTWLLDQILQSCGGRSALFGTVENRVASRTFAAKNTTPGCLDLHRWLREHVEAGGTHAVVEVSSHAIAQHRTEGLRFAAGILTNIAPEHLDYHKTFENYRETKLRFFAELPPTAIAVLSREEKSSQLAAKQTRARIVWYGSESQDGVEGVGVTSEGLSFVWKGVPVRSKLFGYHNLLNLLAAMTVAECQGISRRDIAAAVGKAMAPPGRLEEVASAEAFRVVVDYAHTDGSLEAVLKALRPVTRGRLISVFGCGGDRDRSKRPRMGRVAELGSDQLIITSDNPRTESPENIIQDITTGLDCPNDAVVVEDRREAIGLSIRMAREGDTVLIAGKGHETYQELEGRTIHFDDREIAREFLNESLLGSTL